jgi:hypothetical protein
MTNIEFMDRLKLEARKEIRKLINCIAINYNEVYCGRRLDDMNSQLTVRLPDNLEKDISTLAKKLHLKRADIVRMALEKFVKQDGGEEESSPYDRVKSLLGSISSGTPDLGESHREHLLRKIKRHAQRAV